MKVIRGSYEQQEVIILHMETELHTTTSEVCCSCMQFCTGLLTFICTLGWVASEFRAYSIRPLITQGCAHERGEA